MKEDVVRWKSAVSFSKYNIWLDLIQTQECEQTGDGNQAASAACRHSGSGASLASQCEISSHLASNLVIMTTSL